jgi:hypothetical protein
VFWQTAGIEIGAKVIQVNGVAVSSQAEIVDQIKEADRAEAFIDWTFQLPAADAKKAKEEQEKAAAAKAKRQRGGGGGGGAGTAGAGDIAAAAPAPAPAGAGDIQLELQHSLERVQAAEAELAAEAAEAFNAAATS